MSKALVQLSHALLEWALEEKLPFSAFLKIDEYERCWASIQPEKQNRDLKLPNACICSNKWGDSNAKIPETGDTIAAIPVMYLQLFTKQYFSHIRTSCSSPSHSASISFDHTVPLDTAASELSEVTTDSSASADKPIMDGNVSMNHSVGFRDINHALHAYERPEALENKIPVLN
jgi:hypothetical protein